MGKIESSTAIGTGSVLVPIVFTDALMGLMVLFENSLLFGNLPEGFCTGIELAGPAVVYVLGCLDPLALRSATISCS